jgi:hypothetical protein
MGTHVDENLGATERQMSGRKMLPNLGGVHPAVVLHACEHRSIPSRLRRASPGVPRDSAGS